MLFLELFNKIVTSNSKNFSFFIKKRILTKLLLSIILKKLLNFLFKPFNKNSKLKKTSSIVIVKFYDLRDLSYIMDQFADARF